MSVIFGDHLQVIVRELQDSTAPYNVGSRETQNNALNDHIGTNCCENEVQRSFKAFLDLYTKAVLLLWRLYLENIVR